MKDKPTHPISYTVPDILQIGRIIIVSPNMDTSGVEHQYKPMIYTTNIYRYILIPASSPYQERGKASRNQRCRHIISVGNIDIMGLGGIVFIPSEHWGTLLSLSK